jgi:hypothetical protein
MARIQVQNAWGSLMRDPQSIQWSAPQVPLLLDIMHEEKSQAVYVGEIELPRGRSRPIREHTRITPPPISHY